MGNSVGNEYEPDHVSPPGETLSETIEALGMSQAELARRTGVHPKTVNEIVKGKAPLTPSTALHLERVLGVPASFWNNRERRFREHMARQEERARLKEYADWCRSFPIAAMVRYGWIRKRAEKVRQLEELLSFFAVASPQEWEAMWLGPKAAFRQSPAFEGNRPAVAAWLRMGEVEAMRIKSKDYDKLGFRSALRRARELTIIPPEDGVPELQTTCAGCGVAVVIVPELPRSRVSGAARWLSSRKALIQLSLRHKSDDRFWFSFFHEAGHILLHGKLEVFVDEESRDRVAGKEKEADEFAWDELIPPDAFRPFVDRGRWSRNAIRDFAERTGVSPGIVVGRLQHDGFLPYGRCNELKARFVWT
jgi:addiction module HigA family antidote